MSKFFIPTDRIGLESIQKSIGGTFSVINKMVKAGLAINWHLNGLCFSETPLWPEGHYYQCGFSTEANAKSRTFLDEGDMLYEEVPTIPTALSFSLRPMSAAVYNGRGAGADFSAPLLEVLSKGGFSYEFIDDKEIRAGKLDSFDTLIVPGSPDAGECYYAGLGDLGFDRIRSFLAEKGQYLGICGGAYLPLTSYDKNNRYWLDIVEATDTEGLDYWRTGSGFVSCRIDDDRHPAFSAMALGGSSTMNLVYWEGPSITIKGSNVKPLAHFETLIASGRDPLKPNWDMHDNTMAEEAVRSWYNPLSQELFDRLLAHKCAFAEASYYDSKILLYSPHPEMGNIGYGPRADSLNFLLIYNGLTYLSGK